MTSVDSCPTSVLGSVIERPPTTFSLSVKGDLSTNVLTCATASIVFVLISSERVGWYEIDAHPVNKSSATIIKLIFIIFPLDLE